MPFFDVATAEYWDALNNRPRLLSSRGQRGIGYIVGVSGNTELDGNSEWLVGDIALYVLDYWVRIETNSPLYPLVSVPMLQKALKAYGVWQTIEDAIITYNWYDPVVVEWQYGRNAPIGGLLYILIQNTLGYSTALMLTVWRLAYQFQQGQGSTTLIPKSYVMRSLSTPNLQTVNDYIMNNFTSDNETSLEWFDTQALISYPGLSARAIATALGWSPTQMQLLWAAAYLLTS